MMERLGVRRGCGKRLRLDNSGMDDEDTVRLQFTYVYDDFHPKTRWWKRISWIDGVGWIALIVAGALVFTKLTEKVDGGWKWRGQRGINPIVVYMLIVGAGVWFARIQRRGRAAWERANQPELFVFLISRDGIVWERGPMRVESNWSGFSGYEETDMGFTITGTPGNDSLYFPARVMTEEQRVMLRRLVSEGTSKTRGFEVLPKV
jgi:hypothetical protein